MQSGSRLGGRPSWERDAAQEVVQRFLQHYTEEPGQAEQLAARLKRAKEQGGLTEADLDAVLMLG